VRRSKAVLDTFKAIERWSDVDATLNDGLDDA
jgi:hypothetical protein